MRSRPTAGVGTPSTSFEVLTTSLSVLQKAASGVDADALDRPTPCADWTVAQVLLHAAGDQHAWASFVGSGALPTYNPFDPPARPEGTVADLVDSAVAVASSTWDEVDPASESVPTPLPPIPTLPADVAAARFRVCRAAGCAGWRPACCGPLASPRPRPRVDRLTRRPRGTRLGSAECEVARWIGYDLAVATVPRASARDRRDRMSAATDMRYGQVAQLVRASD